jgi:LemA protein
MRQSGRFQREYQAVTDWIIIVALCVVVLFVLWFFVIYNRLVAMRQDCNAAFANIDVQLKLRHDLIPNLVETVKGYASHERGTLDAVVRARSAAASAQGIGSKAAAENILTSALRQLFALSEAYPSLKANTNFQQLQTDLGSREQARHCTAFLQ